MLKLLFLFIFILYFSSFTRAIKVKTSNGRLEGKSVLMDRKRLHMFKRIPFAQPPIGSLRFRKPQPALNWTDVRDATEYGPSCMITVVRSDFPTNMSEDCLHLNVFTSDKCLKKKNCPIFMMIHGGTFVFGNSVQYNDSQILYKYAQHEIVFVLPAYRVGFLGFADFGHDYEDAPYNVGLYDLIAQLEWIQREIREFGGDPDRVTLMGYSAGATAVEYLMSSPKLKDRDLFSQVFMDSAFPYMSPGRDRNLTRQFVELANCAWDTENNKTLSIQNKLECLRAKTAEELNDITNTIRPSMFHSGPQSSKSLLPAPNYLTMAARRKPLPILVITSPNEMGIMYEADENTRHLCREILGIINLYQNATIEACAYKYSDVYPLIRDFYHAIAAMECRINAGTGWPFEEKKNRNSDKNPCYLGVFAQDGHTRHVDDTLYMVGQHMKNVTQFTADDNLMDQFYPQAIRNFIKGKQPDKNWLPTDKKGKGYFYLNFEVSSSNHSQQRWPTFVSNEWYDMESVQFFFEYLPTVDQNASQFNPEFEDNSGEFNNSSESDEFDGFRPRNNYMLAENEVPRIQQDPLLEYEKFYGFTTLWTLVLMGLLILLFGLLWRARRDRTVDSQYTTKPLQPVYFDEKGRIFQEYGTI